MSASIDTVSSDYININSNTLNDRCDAVIQKALSDQRLVGAVVLINHKGKTIYQSAAGFADREANKPMALDGLFRLSSVSKPIVSVAALVLVAQSRLGLDDPVDRWLPYFRTKLADGDIAVPTVRHLLTHTAGLTYGFLEPEGGGAYAHSGVSDGMECSGLTLDENLQRLAGAPLQYKPGTAWGYSLATDVLGAVIEKVTGTSLPSAVRELVTAPLGLHDTAFHVVDPDRLVPAYVNDKPSPRRMGHRETVPVFEGTAGLIFEPQRALDSASFASGGSGMIGSASDFMRLLQTLSSGGAPLLPGELVQQMGSNHTGDLELAPWPGRGFGLGFTVLKDPQAAGTPESVGSWRLGGAYGHSWFVDPAQSLCVVAFTNTAFEGMFGDFTSELCQAVYGSDARVTTD